MTRTRSLTLVTSALASVLVAVLLAPPSTAGTRGVAVRTDAVDPSGAEALRLLERASDAEAATTYSGVQFVASWSGQPGVSRSHLVRVEHVPGMGTAVEVLDTGDGLEAGSHREAVGAGGSPGRAEALRLLARNYALATAGSATVAGREVDLVEVRHREDTGAGALAARFWLDRDSGVLLRREAYDESGRTVRASSFLDVSIGEPVRMPDVALRLPDAEDGRMGPQGVAAMRAQGWFCPRELAEGLILLEARALEDDSGPIVHLVYSDGLATVSVFEQRGHLDGSALEGFRTARLGDGVVHVRDGMPRHVVWVAEGTVYTVVADASAETTAAVVAALPLPGEDGSSGVMSRIGRGLSRAASWFGLA